MAANIFYKNKNKKEGQTIFRVMAKVLLKKSFAYQWHEYRMKIAAIPLELDTFCKRGYKAPLDYSESQRQSEKGLLLLVNLLTSEWKHNQ